MDDLKLGKLDPVLDKRTIPLRAIIRKELLPPLPETFDVDSDVGGINDNFLFNNSVYGDCVIAARAHQTLRFEKFEQGVQIPIADQEVVDQYFKETGGADNGLVLLYSLKKWRKEGWVVGDKVYTIYAFASVDWKDHDEVKHCIHLLGGVNFGMAVYEKDYDQFQNYQDWTLTGNDGKRLGGHGVYGNAYGFDKDGLFCVTWGRKQFMTWDFWSARVDEAYGIVDNKNHWMADTSPVDLAKLDSYLREVTEGRGEPALPGCSFGWIPRFLRGFYARKGTS